MAGIDMYEEITSLPHCV